MALVGRVDASKFLAKIKRVNALMNRNIQSALEKIGSKMASDITGGRTQKQGSAWSKAQHNAGPEAGKKYDMGDEFSTAVWLALKVNRRTVGFDSKRLDSGTQTEGGGGLGYWRIFEYGGASPSKPRVGSRVNKYSGYSFRPAEGFGHSAEGYNVENSKGKHPGVYPTRPFQDTVFLNRKFIKETFRRAVRNALKGKGL